MGTSRNGRVSKTFDDGKNKVKVRFANERQARRVAMLIEYMTVAFHDGEQIDTIDQLLEQDFTKAKEVISKIEAGHEH
jgi:hypothetical protein